jgi:RNA polymerase subunit RPABC4/transcription elongation factor Spt4
LRCKACNRLTENLEMCNVCETASLDDYGDLNDGYVLPFDPTPDNIAQILKVIKE